MDWRATGAQTAKLVEGLRSCKPVPPPRLTTRTTPQRVSEMLTLEPHSQCRIRQPSIRAWASSISQLWIALSPEVIEPRLLSGGSSPVFGARARAAGL